MTDLRQFIESRRGEIKAEISKLKQELRELGIAEGAIKSGGSATTSATKSTNNKMTIKDMVLDVLVGKTDGAEASEILELIANKHGEIIARASLSPQLSRLKDEGLLFLEGRTWRIAENKRDSEHQASESLSNEIHHDFSRNLDDEIPF